MRFLVCLVFIFLVFIIFCELSYSWLPLLYSFSCSFPSCFVTSTSSTHFLSCFLCLDLCFVLPLYFLVKSVLAHSRVAVSEWSVCPVSVVPSLVLFCLSLGSCFSYFLFYFGRSLSHVCRFQFHFFNSVQPCSPPVALSFYVDILSPCLPLLFVAASLMVPTLVSF